MDESRIKELFEDVIADCHDEDEQFDAIYYFLAEGLDFPLQATLSGEAVEVTDIDRASSLRRGIVATIQRNGQTYQAGVAELTFVDPSEETQELLAVYGKWASF